MFFRGGVIYCNALFQNNIRLKNFNNNNTQQHINSLSAGALFAIASMFQSASNSFSRVRINRKALGSIPLSTFVQNDWGTVIDGSLPQNPDYWNNKQVMDGLVENLRSTVAKIHEGGGVKACAKHKQRNKMLARERVNALVDPGTPFLELSPLAGHGLCTFDSNYDLSHQIFFA